jgi:Zn finger protein HypA/HybF involved in hydrogenase expression
MHEITIANEIIKKAKEREKKIKGVVMEVGELSSITPKELVNAMKSIVDWDIKAKGTKGVVKCACGFEGRPRIVERAHGFVLFECPSCGGAPKVIKGDGIMLKEVIAKVD